MCVCVCVCVGVWVCGCGCVWVWVCGCACLWVCMCGDREVCQPPRLQIWDVPGQIEMQVFDPENMFGGCGALIFIIDAQVGRLAC